jgi:hypothetical protein
MIISPLASLKENTQHGAMGDIAIDNEQGIFFC